MKPDMKDFPKLEDWGYNDLLVFYNQAISWKIDFEKELREKARKYCVGHPCNECLREIVGE